MSAPKIQLYAAGWCAYCARARRLLQDKGVPFEEIDIDARPEARAQMLANVMVTTTGSRMTFGA